MNPCHIYTVNSHPNILPPPSQLSSVWYTNRAITCLLWVLSPSTILLYCLEIPALFQLIFTVHAPHTFSCTFSRQGRFQTYIKGDTVKIIIMSVYQLVMCRLAKKQALVQFSSQHLYWRFLLLSEKAIRKLDSKKQNLGKLIRIHQWMCGCIVWMNTKIMSVKKSCTMPPDLKIFVIQKL